MDAVHRELEQNLSDILTRQFGLTEDTGVMVIYDTQSPLSNLVTETYRRLLKGRSRVYFVDFDQTPHAEILRQIETHLKPKDAVALVQSFSFRVSVYRWRLELFDRQLKVLEHMRLSYMPEDQFLTYAKSLKEESSWLQPTAEKLRDLLTKTNHIRVECTGGSILTYHSTMEKPVVNDGNYSKMKNVGGGYPIGEIFSEPIDLASANGEVEVYAYPGEDHKMRFSQKSFLIKIKDGCVEDGVFPPDFQPLMDMMRKENPDGTIPVREFGLGLNRNITPQHVLTEASAFERIAGLHLSLGWKHGAYLKKFKKQKELVQRYHVDIYPSTKRIWLNDTLVFEDGKFVI